MKLRYTYWQLLVFVLAITYSCTGQRSMTSDTEPPQRAYQQDATITLVHTDTSQVRVPASESITPTFTLQFQLMELADSASTDADFDRLFNNAAVHVDTSIARANRYFKGAIKFVRDPYIYTFDAEGKTIYDLYDDFAARPEQYDQWTAERYVDSAITIFVMPTGVRGEQILLGFCPVVSSGFEFYEEQYPRFDHLFVSYQGLQSGKTLAHELGHYFGLGHVFAMTNEELQKFGLSDQQIQRINLMNYVPHPEELTPEQVFVAWKMAITSRAYRLD